LAVRSGHKMNPNAVNPTTHTNIPDLAPTLPSDPNEIRAFLRKVTGDLILLRETCHQRGIFDGYAHEADLLAGMAQSIYLDATDGPC
jgi:hypothetical protein